MHALKFLFASIFLFASGNLLAAKQPKVAVCHVSGDGEINLIVVSANSNHLGNPNHNWDGITDYAPDDVGASGEGTEDSDGDGVDDGCQPQSTCPCWEELELQSVTAENHYLGGSCSATSFLPFAAQIQTAPDFAPNNFLTINHPAIGVFCQTTDMGLDVRSITEEEADSCINQIVVRCDEVGDPVPTPE